MSIRVDSASLISGALVCGNRGLGVLGSAIPGTGDHGASLLANDVQPGEESSEFRALILTRPSTGTIFFYEDGSFEATDVEDGDGGTYEGFKDGASYGIAAYSFTIGAEATEVTSDLSIAYAVHAAVNADLTASWAIHQPAAQDLTLAYQVHAAVAADLEAAYAVRALVAADLELSYAVEDDSGVVSVTGDLPIAYAVHTPVAADLGAQWAVHQTVERGSDLSWSVHAAVAADLDLGWDVEAEGLSAVASDLPMGYAVHARVQRDLGVAWAVLSVRQSLMYPLAGQRQTFPLAGQRQF